MRFFPIVAALVSVAAAETFTVVVGGNQSLTYSPESVNAKVGDTIQFQFVAKNHTVTQSTFAKPCERMSTPTQGVDSGFLPVPQNATEFPVWSFTLNDASAPLWFYCAQQPHCSRGMVFSVNPTADKTHAAFKANAMGGAAGGASGSASGGSAAATSSAPGTGASASPGGATSTRSGNGALSMTMNAAGLVSIVSLVAGLLL
ncbi:serine-threonine rich [Moniliophthora roreri MCA 2997]|uniref:Serine-threonine rich n=2 Tax=Moniliophthora roreri TaxID=221103 RepID=V2XRT0_MONRO|nr:serine-threonine rich [Moniliophthora roreri MCA 2997]